MKLLVAATIQFVGLCMVRSGEAPNTVEVVLPRIEQISMAAMRHTQTKGPKTSSNAAKSAVDTGAHTAIIAYKVAKETPAGWVPAKLRPAPEYWYVTLTHERLQIAIDPTATPEVPKVPPELPRMKHNCETAELVPEYDRPYSRAAAVVDVTGGKLVACRPKFGNYTGQRIDTQWTLPGSPSTITITAGTKKLVVDAGSAVIIGNVPNTWLNSDPADPTTSNIDVEGAHYRGFYTMLKNSDQCTQQLVTVGECMGPELNITLGGWRPARKNDPHTNTAKMTAPITQQMETYSCSNSQYP